MRPSRLPVFLLIGWAFPSACKPDHSAPDAGPVDAATDAPIDDEPVPCEARISYHPSGATPGRVVVAGQWNAWSQDLDPLSDDDGDGTFERLLELRPGRYAYKLVVDGEWIFDPANTVTMWHEGVENSRLDVADCRLPRLEVESASATADGQLTAAVRYVDGVRAAGADPDSARVTLDGAALDVTLQADAFAVDETGLAAGKHTLRFAAADRDGRAAVDAVVPFWVEPEPFSWQDALLYFVFTDRFRDGDRDRNGSVEGVDPPANFGGGDLAGDLDAIEDGTFDELGVRALWLSPIEDAPDRSERGSDGRMYTGYHGYWPVAPRSVDEHLGDEAILRQVVDAAHAHGIRVLLDLVLNHVHTNHPYARDHAADGWFNGDGSCVCESCGWDTHAIDCWFTPYLPDFDYRNADAVDTMVGDAVYWVREVGVDGFRVDAVKHVEVAVLRSLVARLGDLEHGGVHHYLVGETFTGEDGRGQIAAFLGPGLLDGQFDFPLQWPIVRTLLRREGPLGELDDAVTANDGAYPPGTVMAPFLGNHDVPRAISHAAGQIGDLFGNGSKEQGWTDPPPQPTDPIAYDRVAVAFTFLITQPGAPLLYYGDEVGLAGAGDPDNRRMMPTEESLTALQRGLRDTVRALGQARRDLVGLRRGARRTLWVDDTFYAWARGEGADAVVVAINAGDAERTVSVPLPAAVGIADGTDLTDRLGGGAARAAAGSVSITLPARRGALLARCEARWSAALPAVHPPAVLLPGEPQLVLLALGAARAGRRDDRPDLRGLAVAAGRAQLDLRGVGPHGLGEQCHLGGALDSFSVPRRLGDLDAVEHVARRQSRRRVVLAGRERLEERACRAVGLGERRLALAGGEEQAEQRQAREHAREGSRGRSPGSARALAFRASGSYVPGTCRTQAGLEVDRHAPGSHRLLFRFRRLW